MSKEQSIIERVVNEQSSANAIAILSSWIDEGLTNLPTQRERNDEGENSAMQMQTRSAGQSARQKQQSHE